MLEIYKKQKTCVYNKNKILNKSFKNYFSMNHESGEYPMNNNSRGRIRCLHRPIFQARPGPVQKLKIRPVRKLTLARPGPL